MQTTRGTLWSIAMMVAIGSGPGLAAASAEPEIVDLNRASYEELLTVEGIGRQYAGKIVAARPFVTRNELVVRNVLPMPVYLALKHKLYVTPTSSTVEERPRGPVPAGMIDLNQATLDDLLAVPGIGRAYAARVLAGRPYRHEMELVGRRIMPLSVFRAVEGRIAIAR